MSRSSKKYSGCLFGQKVDASGQALGAIFKWGNVFPLEIKMGVNVYDMISALCDSAGQNLESRVELDGVTGSMSVYQYGAEEIGLAVGAEPVAMTGEGATLDPVSVVAPAVGAWLEVGHENLTAFALTNEAGDVTYVKDVDYLLNEPLGMWSPLSAGAITPGDTVMQGYTYAAESGYQLEVAQVLQNNYRIFGVLKEIKTGATVNINLKCVTLTSDNGLTLISDPKTEYESLDFGLNFITPPGHTSPATIKGVPAE